jgi:hypothetical protein
MLREQYQAEDASDVPIFDGLEPIDFHVLVLEFPSRFASHRKRNRSGLTHMSCDSGERKD